MPTQQLNRFWHWGKIECGRASRLGGQSCEGSKIGISMVEVPQGQQVEKHLAKGLYITRLGLLEIFFVLVFLLSCGLWPCAVSSHFTALYLWDGEWI